MVFFVAEFRLAVSAIAFSKVGPSICAFEVSFWVACLNHSVQAPFCSSAAMLLMTHRAYIHCWAASACLLNSSHTCIIPRGMTVMTMVAASLFMGIKEARKLKRGNKNGKMTASWSPQSTEIKCSWYRSPNVSSAHIATECAISNRKSTDRLALQKLYLKQKKQLDRAFPIFRPITYGWGASHWTN